MSDYPFPFVGSGDAQYFEWAEVHVLFERAPTDAEQSAIAERVPPPLQDSVDFDDIHLMVASDQFAHAAMMDAYEKADDDDSEDSFDGRFPFAATSKVRAFDEDTEAWLAFAHEQCPILVAFRREDWEAGGTDLDGWHDWSVERLGDVFDRLEPDTLGDGALWTVRGLLEYATDSIDDIPPGWRDVALPGQREVEAIEAGDVDELRAALQAREARWEDALERITEQVDDEDPEQLATLVGAADLLFDRDLDASTVMLLARAALGAEAERRDAIMGDVADRCAADSYAASLVGQLAYEMIIEQRWEDSWVLFDILLQLPNGTLTSYSNALYAVMTDNTGLGVQPDRARRYVDAALPHGPDNPAIFHNTACVFMELGETDRVYEYLEAALEHDYDQPEQMRDDEIFEPIRDEPRFQALFDDDA